jgi:hypothetical protein
MRLSVHWADNNVAQSNWKAEPN